MTRRRPSAYPTVHNVHLTNFMTFRPKSARTTVCCALSMKLTHWKFINASRKWTAKKMSFMMIRWNNVWKNLHCVQSSKDMMRPLNNAWSWTSLHQLTCRIWYTQVEISRTILPSMNQECQKKCWKTVHCQHLTSTTWPRHVLTVHQQILTLTCKRTCVSHAMQDSPSTHMKRSARRWLKPHTHKL